MARTRDNPAVPQRSSTSKSQVAATPSSFDSFMLKMKRRVDEQGIPAQATPKADRASMQDDVFFTPEAPAQARPAGDKVSLDEVSSTIDEVPDSRMCLPEEFRGGQISLNMSLLNSGLQSSSDSGLAAVKNRTSTTSNKGFGGARPLPALPDRPKNVERPVSNPRLFESRPEIKPIEHIQSEKTTTTAGKPETPADGAIKDEDSKEHIAKLKRCLEIHTLLLTRVNALPIDDDSPVIPQLHGYLSSCERRLHYLLPNAPGSAFGGSASSSLSGQQELAEQCINTLEMVTKETLAIEARNAGELPLAGRGVIRDLEAAGGEDVDCSGSGSQGRSGPEDSGKLSPENVSSKKRRGYRGPRKSKSKKKEAAAVGDEQQSEAEEEDVWQSGVPLNLGKAVWMERRIEAAEREKI